MNKQRIPETNSGITGTITVNDYDLMQRNLRDKGFMETDDIIKSGIDHGVALEIGPGPGYLGLEWLKKTKNTRLQWLEISEDMKGVALKNVQEYNLNRRIDITVSDATKKFPFNDNRFDAVFTNGSLHEWEDPVQVFNEIMRVIKTGGRFFISDLKRNINPVIIFIMKLLTKQKTIKKGLISSINAAYVKTEIAEIIPKSSIKNYSIAENAFGITITGKK